MITRLVFITIIFCLGVPAAVLPAGFTEVELTASLTSATAMALAPDGRIFVCQQGGALRIIKNGALLPQPFVTLTVSPAGERGLLGVALDPNFVANRFVYVYYTATTPSVHNRVSRFTANGDVAAAGSELILLELDNLSAATNHNGGALHFGPDGKLYIAVGENANPNYAQTLSNLLGKILRINSDGTIPADNPFVNQTNGKNQAIWSLGLRNPFTFSFQSGTGRMFINDVGQNTWEEINDGLRGANYGWPTTEGPTSDPRFVGPLFAYAHSAGACAITGGAFYNPGNIRFPPSYVGKYFFADYCARWIRIYDPVSDTDASFATDAGNVVDLAVSSGGKLYYLNGSSVFEIDFPSSSGGELMGHWPFNEGAGSVTADISGSGYHGGVNGASWTTGKMGSALNFNGSTSYAVTPAIPLASTFSISAWVNPAVTTQASYARIAETRYNGGFYLGTDVSSTKYKFIVNTGAGATGTCGAAFGCAEGGTITPGWHLVTGTFDGTTGRLYVDGALVSSETFTAPSNTNFPLYIGRAYAGNGWGWRGAIDDVRLYDKELSSTDVAALYNEILLGYWRFDEGSGAFARDTSGHTYHAAVNGASWTNGKVNSALSFNGSTSHVVTPAIPLANTFSISAWVNPAVTTQARYARIAETRYNGGFYLGTDFSSTKYKFIVNTGAGATGTCGAAFGCAEGGTITPGWHLVTGTFDGATGRLYVDGALVSSDTFTAPSNTNFSLYIGRAYAGNGWGWFGVIDEVRLYRQALTALEVASLYAETQ